MSREIWPLDAAEVETLVGWAEAEGWNPGIGDAAAFHAADPDGFLGAFVDGKLVAGISAVAYGASFGFIGLYICRPEFRGQGHGKAVWDAGMARLAGRTVGLDGVPEQQANYARMGFAKAYETMRLSGIPPRVLAPVVDALPFDELVALDRECFPEDRMAFLEAWLERPRILQAVASGGHLLGYGIVRPCFEGFKIGPLFARSGDVALTLISSLSEAVGGPVQIDVPMTQASFYSRLTEAGMTPGFSTARMYLGPAPKVAMHQVFGTTTLELG